MSHRADDLCPRPQRVARQSTEPHVPPIYLSSVYECRDAQQADALLSGRQSGYVYLRDGHPNADLLAEKCRQLHGTERAAIAASGMAALALAVLSQLEPGDHVVVSDQLYGRSSVLLSDETARYGIASTTVDAYDLDAVRAAITPQTRLVVVETISNPLLRVADLAALAELTHRAGAALLADNTLAGPAVCRPVELGADWVMESITKSMNGHSDVVLGLLCGPADRWQRVPNVLSTWGSPARRSIAGWRCAVWRRWRCASSGPVPMPWRPRSASPNRKRSRRSTIRACPPIVITRWHVASSATDSVRS